MYISNLLDFFNISTFFFEKSDKRGSYIANQWVHVYTTIIQDTCRMDGWIRTYQKIYLCLAQWPNICVHQLGDPASLSVTNYLLRPTIFGDKMIRRKIYKMIRSIYIFSSLCLNQLGHCANYLSPIIIDVYKVETTTVTNYLAFSVTNYLAKCFVLAQWPNSCRTPIIFGQCTLIFCYQINIHSVW